MPTTTSPRPPEALQKSHQPPVIAAARTAWEAGDRESAFWLYLDVDATLITCWCDDREGLRRAAATTRRGVRALIRWWSTWTAGTGWARRWRAAARG